MIVVTITTTTITTAAAAITTTTTTTTHEQLLVAENKRLQREIDLLKKLAMQESLQPQVGKQQQHEAVAFILMDFEKCCKHLLQW